MTNAAGGYNKMRAELGSGRIAMLPSVRAFLAGIIDYAGLFPPAQLPLDEAIRRYARYRTEPESWMMGRFVCPLSLVPDLISYAVFCLKKKKSQYESQKLIVICIC